ncbi:YlmH/Sll1252 family protein [Irregularibacter muris]|uniref:YlmH/Sll1252 family protein n=1 Tax=Irregularibacter muris TaxID=1796619 RepID=A0AAE3KZ62_9FIRM|nr:YlmH/Sll1252 family protein [Irregularibacter muris]MCR1898186.1 YlmH/Sll1252 family protein [Irregularibacter muris]
MKKEKDILLKAKVEDCIKIATLSHRHKFLYFLDPGEQQFCKEILTNIKGIQWEFFGGYEHAERKILCVYSRGEDLTIWEWPITAFHIIPKDNQKDLRHPDILGSLVHLGIERNRIGDINVFPEFIQVFIAEELKDFIVYNLEKISNIPVHVKEIGWDQVMPYSPPFKEIYITSASLRLDGMISSIYGLSRKDSSALIISKKVKVNWTDIEKPSALLKEGDLVSVRGKGRVLVNRVLGETKKGNKKVLIHKFI